MDRKNPEAGARAAVTIKDIARISGFGVGTVSRVLNGSPLVRDKTRAKILAVAKRLRYKPNKLAKMLVTGRYSESTIGIILPLITHRFALEIVAGIYSKLNELGYNLLVFNIGKRRDEVFEHIRYVNFSGLLTLINPLTAAEKKMLSDHYSRFIYLDYHEQGENAIFFDHRHGGGLAASYLLQKQCRKIGFIGDRNETQQQSERIEGFKEALSVQGATLKAELYIQIDEEESYRLSKELMGKGRVDGIFYYCDDLALGGLRAKAEMGSGIRLVGYDDIQAAGYLGLSTVRQDAKLLGQLGAERIVELIHPVQTQESIQEEPAVIFQCLKPRLIDRGS